jgi:micrococcal nuclease
MIQQTMICFSHDIQGLAATAVFCTVGLTVLQTPPHLLTQSAPQKPITIPSIVGAQNRTITPRIPIEVLRVIDGDTVEVRAQIWLDQHITTKVRLRSIDAPELHAKCPAEAKLAEGSRHHLITLVSSGQTYLTDIGRDKYGGRVVGNILTHQVEDVATRLLAEGHARPYRGGKRGGWC